MGHIDPNKPIRIYACSSYAAADVAHKLRNKVHEATRADKFFTEADYPACADMCYEVLQAEPSEAIRAKCHMYLANENVGPGHASARACVPGDRNLAMVLTSVG